MNLGPPDYVSKLYEQKEDILNEINTIEIEHNMDGIRRDLEQIKAQEKRNGEFQGKARVYYKKGTPERQRKDYLKKQLKEFEEHNSQYCELKKVFIILVTRLSSLRQIQQNMTIRLHLYLIV